MAGYLTLAEFRSRSTMPAADIDSLESVHPGWIEQQIETVSRVDIDPRLRKRYAAPFVAPYPEAVKAWCERIVTPRAYRRRGVSAADEHFSLAIEDAKAAKTEILEAANGEGGLYELPLIDGPDNSAITKGDPFSYSEPGPYDWTDVQREAVK